MYCRSLAVLALGSLATGTGRTQFSYFALARPTQRCNWPTGFETGTWSSFSSAFF
jgi:hypothetical protein